jgi:hypothetical protein
MKRIPNRMIEGIDELAQVHGAVAIRSLQRARHPERRELLKPLPDTAVRPPGAASGRVYYCLGSPDIAFRIREASAEAFPSSPC